MSSTGDRPAATAMIARGVLRLFRRLDCAALPEVVLGNRRRADILAMDRHGRLIIVEVKSSPEDFRSDRKWCEYLAYCDEFAFAVGPDFPVRLLPPEPGVIVADRHDATIFRPPTGASSLPPARRRALTLTFARTAASRLALIVDPFDAGQRLTAREL
ncbi:MAG: MmcB family DNA repair protein [Rhodospirillales bacterium]|nr:MmcB family DNA repair protein [Rhodospirillales bacterium]